MSNDNEEFLDGAGDTMVALLDKSRLWPALVMKNSDETPLYLSSIYRDVAYRFGDINVVWWKNEIRFQSYEAMMEVKDIMTTHLNIEFNIRFEGLMFEE